MTAEGDLTLVWAAGSGAIFFVLVDLALSAALVSVQSLGPVARHRLAADSDGRLDFVEDLASPTSSCGMAAVVVRQIALLGTATLAGAAAALAGLPNPWLVGTALAAVVGVLVTELVLARLVALRYPRVVLRAVSPAMRLLRFVAGPVLRPLASVARRVEVDVVNGDGAHEEDAEAETEAFIEVAEKEGILEASESRMVRGIVDLGERLVREIMTPRTDILALPADVPVREGLRLLRRANHTRLPVYRETIDDIVGVLHVRDLVQAWEEGRDSESIQAFVRPAFFVPEVLSVADLLAEMRTRTHIALVVDEYGGIAGLVTLEDVLEEIVGDIRDEHDLEEALITEQPDGSWLVSGSAHVDRLEKVFGVDVDEEREFDTVGGLVVSTLGRVPAEGEALDLQGLRIEIVKADPRRVYRVRVTRLDSRDPAASSGP